MRVLAPVRVAAVAVSVAVLIALAVSLPEVVSAEEPGEETFVTRLEPGDNYVGWTTRAEPVEQLFGELPQIDAIWTWDVGGSRWKMASPHVPERMWTLRTLEPGMGLIVRLGSDESVEWERDRRPARGTVRLQPGMNLVTWVGRDQTPLDRVVQGIGRTFELVGHQNGNDARIAWHSQEEVEAQSDQPIIGFGDALWVQVGRPVNWLQPTGILPPVRFPDSTSESDRHKWLSVLREIVDFFWETQGVEADFADIVVILPAVVEDHVAMLREHFPHRFQDEPYEDTLSWLQGDGWWYGGYADDNYRPVTLMVKNNVPPGGDVTAHALALVHEYSHGLQSLLRIGQRGFKSVVPIWLAEGQAELMEDAFRVWREEETTWQTQLTNAVGRYQNDVNNDHRIFYSGGLLAMHRLREATEVDSWTEFWRQMIVTDNSIGVYGRCASEQWAIAFEQAYGFTPSELYDALVDTYGAQFEQLKEDPRYARPSVDSNIVGRVVCAQDTHGGRIQTASISASGEDGGHDGWFTRSDGTFGLAVPEGDRYRVKVSVNGCTVYHGKLQATANYYEATLVDVRPSSVIVVEVRIPPNLCNTTIEGYLVDEHGRGLGGTEVLAWTEESASDTHVTRTRKSVVGRGRTAPDGAFTILVPSPGSYELDTRINSCQIDYRQGGFAGANRDATAIEVARAGASEIRFQIPEGMCELRISGKLLNADGSPRSGAYMLASGTPGRGGQHTASDGSFSFAVPSSGSYQLGAAVDGCLIYLGRDGTGVDRSSAWNVEVTNADVTGIEFRLPENPAAFCD